MADKYRISNKAKASGSERMSNSEGFSTSIFLIPCSIFCGSIFEMTSNQIKIERFVVQYTETINIDERKAEYWDETGCEAKADR